MTITGDFSVGYLLCGEQKANIVDSLQWTRGANECLRCGGHPRRASFEDDRRFVRFEVKPEDGVAGERARELVITTRNIDTDHVQVAVEDSGVGLDPNTMQKIFEPFYTTKPTGMGMGLSISRSIVQSHGGRPWATAKDGPGTIFYFTLPKYHEEESNEGSLARSELTAHYGGVRKIGKPTL